MGLSVHDTLGRTTRRLVNLQTIELCLSRQPPLQSHCRADNCDVKWQVFSYSYVRYGVALNTYKHGSHLSANNQSVTNESQNLLDLLDFFETWNGL